MQNSNLFKKGGTMKINATILGILAIFCVVLSVCAVSANANVNHYASDNGNYYLDASHDGHDGLIIPPDINHDEQKQMAGGDHVSAASQDANHTVKVLKNATNSTTHATNSTGNATAHVAHAANATNATGNATHNTAKLPATGNPVLLILLIAGAAAGAYSIRRRK